MCNFANDEDMKIVGEEQSVQVDDTAEWRAHKGCGNIDRAHRLGKNLAQQLLTLQNNDPAKQLQQQMLFAFTADFIGGLLVTDALLAQTARGTFFARLRDLLPDFEITMHRLGAFTFYRMAVDGSTPDALPAGKVGAVYAALCGCAGDDTTEQEGASLFMGYAKRLQETVSMVDFERI